MTAAAQGYRCGVPTGLTALHAADLTIASVPSGHVYARHVERWIPCWRRGDRHELALHDAMAVLHA